MLQKKTRLINIANRTYKNLIFGASQQILQLQGYESSIAEVKHIKNWLRLAKRDINLFEEGLPQN